ncbi:MAG: DNA polymerase III subunit chi [Paracoccaceae bacterium]
MGAVFFYHLTRKPLDQTLPMLLTKARDAGMKIVVRGSDRARLEWLDEKLWHGAKDSFLAHGLDGGAQDALQPILLTENPDLPDTVKCLMSIDGAQVTAEEVTALDRVCILFDGIDGDAVQYARKQWKTLTDQGCSAQYWSEEGGKWEKKAEK